MGKCEECGTSLYNTSECELCGGTYCVKHWDPEDHKCVICDICGEHANLVCEDCDGRFCREHIDREKHNCAISNNNQAGVPDHASKTENEGVKASIEQYSKERSGNSNRKANEKSNTGRFIGGAILLATGAILTVSAIGAVFGIPLMMLGFGIMFPRFTVAMIILSVVSFVGLLMFL